MIGEAESLARSIKSRERRQHLTRASDRWSIFLAGATGYLGTEMLHSLIQTPIIGRIHVLVRARSKSEATERVATSTTTAGWWRQKDLQRIEFWLGDLAKPHFDLPHQEWQGISGLSEIEENIDGVIHYGASVN